MLVGTLAGCGGGGGEKTPQVSQRSLRGQGFEASVPRAWTVARGERSITARDGASLLSVSTLPLQRVYKESLFASVTNELDGVVAQLAAKENGKVSKRETVTLAGRRARAYTIDRGKQQERLGFVLSGRREYELYCRYAPASDAETACSSLFESFRLA